MQLSYTADELCQEHAYAREHVVAGHRLHGGFDAEGAYISPRTLVRWPAVRAWTAALRERGGDLLDADSSLLSGVRTPNDAQQKLLILEGLGQTFWNTLTITGRIEARGRVLAEIPLPDFQAVMVEDISRMALGHAGRGLFRAHGLDEGGEAERGLGGHDVMWFALRDLAFGDPGYPEPELPAAITRPDTAEPMPELPRPQARMLSFLMNLLMIELRAEIGFRSTERLLRDDELFIERRAQAVEAAEVVGRIRQDEEVHVASLRLMLGEARALTFKTQAGDTVPGSSLIDPFWRDLVHWATVKQPRLAAERSRELLRQRILAHPRGSDILERFEALGG